MVINTYINTSIQSLGLIKLSHNTAILKALYIEKIEDIVNINVSSLYNRIFKVESPARLVLYFMVKRYLEPCWKIYTEFYILYHATVCIVAIYFIVSCFYSSPCVLYM